MPLQSFNIWRSESGLAYRLAQGLAEQRRVDRAHEFICFLKEIEHG
jgi:hypothetical protein